MSHVSGLMTLVRPADRAGVADEAVFPAITSLEDPATYLNVPASSRSLICMINPGRAEEIARGLLEQELPRRWAHVQGVAATARTLCGMLGDDADLIVIAAWLHDVGYAPTIASTGFHALDGARYLRDECRADSLLCRLVAHHSGATFEAAERGLRRELTDEFPLAPVDLLDALTYCDMTTGPDGQRTSVQQRLAEIQTRYRPDDPVGRALAKSAPQIRESAARVARRTYS
jgi:predicted hydrolase (HD superfamily)